MWEKEGTGAQQVLPVTEEGYSAREETGQNTKQAEEGCSPKTHLWPDSWKSRVMLAGTQ